MPKNDTPVGDGDVDLSEQVGDFAKGDVSEGDLHAIRDSLKLERLAGSESTRREWEASEDGRNFMKNEAPERAKQAEAENKAVVEQQKQSEDALKKYEGALKSRIQQAEKAAKQAEKNPSSGSNDK